MPPADATPPPLRWGILGCGRIAEKFAAALADTPGATLAAAGARDAGRAAEFAARHGAGRHHGSYRALVDDPGVDAVYVATPHVFHREQTCLALAAGKHVLCEKPLAMNAAEAREMVALARRQGRFLMEAMRGRFHPGMARVREILGSGVLGEPRLLTAGFSVAQEENPAGRHFNPDLGGGALLDVGVYPVSFASLIFGPPAEVAALARIGTTGVDEWAGMLLKAPGGGLAVLHCAARCDGDQGATLTGSGGRLTFAPKWWHATAFTLSVGGREDEHFSFPVRGNGYGHQAEEVARCVGAGLLESPVMPWGESVEIMDTLDRLRRKIDLRYPGGA